MVLSDDLDTAIWDDDRTTRAVYSTDNSIYQVEPARVGTPSTANDIAALLRANRRSPAPLPIVARGGGTGTNGQSLTDGIVVDLKRNLNSIIDIDIEKRRAVVQPGVVTGQLNSVLAADDLHWAPHTSTLNRATVGGMISTDAAGKGSLIYGRAHRHVEQLEMLLDDGTAWAAESVSVHEAHRRAALGGRGGELWQTLLDIDVDKAMLEGLPELARGFSGYGIDRLRHGDVIDPVALVCGAEGTLGIVTQATLVLHPVVSDKQLVVASYPSFDDALQDAIALRSTKPLAIECFDETTLERGRSSPAWGALGAAIGDHQGAVLLLEYGAESSSDVAEVVAAMRKTSRSTAAEIVGDTSAQASIWKVRADAVGLLARTAVGGPDKSARPTAFVEDCAVPVDRMPSFIEGFRRVLDAAGLEYGMFGHADVGCVHVRPALDLTDPGDRDLVARVTDQVIELVTEHGGLLWGEHGRGFRGASADQVLSASAVRVMREIKRAFDPGDLFNPGKLYRPLGSGEPLFGVTDPPMRGEFDAAVPVEIRRRFDSAFACNGNGLCHDYSTSSVMCPSYKATGDPALSPKGRADLLRRWLRLRGDTSAASGELVQLDQNEIDAFEQDIATNLHQCLSCSACSGQCPVEVDIPELKSQFLERYYETHRRPPNHTLLSRFEDLASLTKRVPWLAKLGAKPVGRALGLVDLPAPATGPRLAHTRFGPGVASDLVFIPDVFTGALEPDVLDRAVQVAESVGWSCAVAPFVASGKFDHVKGRRSHFAKLVAKQAELVKEIVASGSVPVVIEPAVALLHGREYPTAMANYPTGAVRSLADVLVERTEALVGRSDGQPVTLLGHCTERATAPTSASNWSVILDAAGYRTQTPAVGCCGMAGIFGHEAGNQVLSRQVWDMSWADVVARSGRVVAPGYSCRSQIKRFGDAGAEHPVMLL